MASTGQKYDFTDADVTVEIEMNAIEISDDLEAGNLVGEIIEMVYIGDHYQLVVRTEDEDDFVVDTEWTWNEFDKVSISVKKEMMKLTLKGDIARYEI